MALHFTVHTLDDALAFATWEDALRLWTVVASHTPDLTALTLMNNHFHLLHERDVLRDLGVALSAYTRYFNARTGRRGPLWMDVPRPTEATGKKARRDIRYIHLNPCRAGLAPCPLGWPFSTHRDACGFAISGVRTVMANVHDFHAYVSSDPSVSVAGTELPHAPRHEPSLDEIEAAVSSLLRVPVEALRQRSPHRALLVQAARALTTKRVADIGDRFGVTSRTVVRSSSARRGPVLLVARVVGDPRFAALSGTPPGCRGWTR